MRRTGGQWHLHMGCGESLTAKRSLQRSSTSAPSLERARCFANRAGKDKR